MKGVQSALREWKGVLTPLAFWALSSFLTAVSGPFGTHAVLEFWPRLGYWSVICAMSVGLSLVAIRALEGSGRVRRVLVWLSFAVLLSTIIHLTNSLWFSAWTGWRDHLALLGYVGIVTVLVLAVIWITERSIAQPDQSGADEVEERLAQFLARLPFEKRAPLVRIEAQDHYLNVVTQAGESLILLRFGDAVSALEGVGGMQVHRSHWVARDGIQETKRQGGRDLLVMKDGAEVPISRSFKAHFK